MPKLIDSKTKSNKNQVFADLKGCADAAYRWRDEGYLPVPLRLKGNVDLVPAIKWGDVKSVSDADIKSWFGPDCAGIAIKTGATFGGLIDIDLDCTEAVKLASRFLPETGCIFGRPGNPASHYLYHVDHPDPIKKTTFESPGVGKPIVEILADGQIVIAPPSVKHKHAEPETVRFEPDKDGLPSEVAYADLLTWVRRLAVALVIVRAYPKTQGGRHEMALPHAGALLRSGLTVEEAKHFIGAVAKAAGDPEIEDRLTAVDTTAEKLANDEPSTGWPELAKLLGDEVWAAKGWLDDDAGADTPDKDSDDLGYADCILTGAQLASLEIPPAEWLIEGVIEKSSITLVQGQYKAFKTFTAYGLAEGLCCGAAFVGYKVPQKRRVLLVDGEMPLGQAQDRYEKMIGPAGNDDFFILSNHQLMRHGYPPIDITDKRHQLEIERYIAEHEIDMVIFDNYSALRSLVDENDAADPRWHALRGWLIYLRFKGLAVVLIHHTGHGGKHARGTSELPGIVDTILHQERINETTYKISFTCRGPQPEPSEKIIYVKDAGEVIILTGADVKPDDWPTILKVIKAGGFKNQTELGVKLGEALGTGSWKQATVSKKLKQGQEKGYVGKGTKLTEAGENLILEGKDPTQE